MSIQDVLGWASVFASFVSVFSAMLFIAAAYRRKRGSSHVSEEGSRFGCAAWYLRNGIGWAKPFARILLKNARMRELAAEAVEALSSRGYVTERESLLSTFCLLSAVVSGLGGLVSCSPVCAIAIMGCAVALALFWVNGVRERRLQETRESVPEALHSMEVCFQAGLSLLQTFRQVATEVRGPLQKLFDHASHQLETGQSVEDALAAFRREASAPELSFVAVALDVQHEVGGGMQRVLEAVRDAVKGEIELKRALRVQTAQAKLSAQVVSVLPFVLVALFSLLSEGFLAPFFESLTGMILLGIALAMQAAGILLVRRTLAVEVN